MKFPCKQCGKIFIPRDQIPSHLKRKTPEYCSYKCSHRARFHQITVSCVICGQHFKRKRYLALTKHERGQFCSLKCYALWQKRNLKGKNSPYYKPEIRITLDCRWCGKTFEREEKRHKRGVSETGNAFCSTRCFKAYAQVAFQGKRPKPWISKIWKCRRRIALKRDGYKCADCGMNIGLVVHHLLPFSEFKDPNQANRLSNLLTVCKACHRKRHETLKKLTYGRSQDTD